MGQKFIYVTYIRTTQEKLWEALTKPEFTNQYWGGTTMQCDWKKGAPWQLQFADGRIADIGKVLEIDPPRRLVLEWRHQLMPELKEEGDITRASFDMEQTDDVVKLTVTHESDRDQSKLIGGVSSGWPKILSNLKSLLETGQVLSTAKPCGKAA